MEHCQHCGAPGRPGAKFCTTCGNPFSGGGNIAVPVGFEGAMSSDREDNSTADATEAMAGWPAAPPPAESFVGTGWDRETRSSAAADPGVTDETADNEATFWRETASDDWPSLPAEGNAANDPAQSVPDPALELDADPEVDPGAVNNVANGEAVARAERLLDELRAAIGAIGHGGGPDLSGVISDLEVAVTPPGAVAPDDVTELREALLAARERPRDLDTIVDLTQRVDALLALIIAYDRAIAAIERSLGTLRRS
jgi:hypothetical protein